MVNTLQDIRDNKQLLIDGHHQYLSYMAYINKLDIVDILARMKEDEIHFKNMKNTLEHIIMEHKMVMVSVFSITYIHKNC